MWEHSLQDAPAQPQALLGRPSALGATRQANSGLNGLSPEKKREMMMLWAVDGPGDLGPDLLFLLRKHTQTATLGTTSGHSAPRSPHQTCLRSAGYLSLDTGAYFFSGQGEASGPYTRAAGLKQGSRADLQTVPK